ncbi:hypothetical protein HDU93_003344 [Gonapodya sp. JEL0774]|nr:hypothetical protein HDU93_003344 [Gonapodya sp. JEL0774]
MSEFVPYHQALRNQPELTKEVQLDVHGTFPAWISGVLYRQGPGLYDVTLSEAAAKATKMHEFVTDHWFDGLAMVHRLEIENGQVNYRSRLTASKLLKEIEEKGDGDLVWFGKKDPTLAPLLSNPLQITRLFHSPTHITHTPSVTISPQWPLPSSLLKSVRGSTASKGVRTLVSKTDANLLQGIDPVTLEDTQGLFTYAAYDEQLGGPMVASHSCLDPATNVRYNFSIKPGLTPICTVFSLTPDEELGATTEIIAQFTAPYLSYIHSFWMSENYIVIPFAPFHLSYNGLSLFWYRNFLESLVWEPEKPLVLAVVDKKAKRFVGLVNSKGLFGAHTNNAFEVDAGNGTKHLVLDWIASDQIGVPRAVMDNIRRYFHDSPHVFGDICRHVVTIEKASTGKEVLTCNFTRFIKASALEFPRIHPNLSALPYRVVYTAGEGARADGKRFLHGPIRKIVMPPFSGPPKSSGTSDEDIIKATWFPEGMYPSEPIFVPRPGANEEDDGVLLVICFDVSDQSGCLVALDASTLKEIARAGWYGVAEGDGGLKGGKHVINFGQLNDANERVFPAIQSLVETFFFRFFRVNLWKDCEFWQDGMFCSNRQCAVEETVEADLPDSLKSGNLGGVDLSMSSKHVGFGRFSDCKIPEKDWCILDNENSGDGHYIDLIKNPERFTGYSGESAARVWRAVYSENCFDLPGRQFNEPVCAEKMIFYRIISGLHASISLHICNNWLDRATGDWQRIDTNPQYIQNIYLDYVILVRAISKIAPYLEKYRFCADDGEHEEVGKLVKEVVAKASECPSSFDEKGLFADGDKQLIRDIKDRFRNVSKIMDCVSCEKCRMWGKLQMTGLGTALKLLFSYGDNPAEYRFTRTEIVALFNTFHRYSSSIESIKRFRRMELEDGVRPTSGEGIENTLASNASEQGGEERTLMDVPSVDYSFVALVTTAAMGFVGASMLFLRSCVNGGEHRSDLPNGKRNYNSSTPFAGTDNTTASLGKKAKANLGRVVRTET